MSLTYIDRELVRNPYHVALCTSEEAFQKELRRLKVPKEQWGDFLRTTHADATAHCFEHSSGRSIALVCIKRRKRLRCEIDGLLIHEAVHIWQWVRDRMGEDAPSKEFEAYSIQAIAQKLIYAYWEKARTC